MQEVKTKIIDAISRLDLNLKGKVVLTEAATGAYVVTPVIAAMAGAEVYAFTKNTRYGTVENVKQQTSELLALFKKNNAVLNIVDKLTPEIISKADIITNSGHLRPLDEKMLKHAKDSVAIPMMYEAWEFRDADMDINYIKKRGIKLGATNERHPDIDVFNYLGDMALKMIFDAGMCPYKNNFVLVCNNDFGPFIAKVLSKVCNKLAVCDTAKNKVKYKSIKVDWAGNFPDLKISEKYRDATAIVFTAYPFDTNWIGKDTLISSDYIKSAFNSPLILRYAGDVDENYLAKLGIGIYPKHVESGHMGILPSAIGLDPVIRLQSGGLKVGELLLKNQNKYKNKIILK